MPDWTSERRLGVALVRSDALSGVPGLAHAFSVHNLKARTASHLYGIRQANALSCKERSAALPGYAPHSQRQLTDALSCFRIDRSVLLPDSRLELLLSAK